MRFRLFICLFLSFSLQIQGQKQDLKAEMSNHVYPLYLANDSMLIAIASCFFVKYDTHYYAITAAHALINIKTGLKQNIKYMSIYLDPNNRTALGWEMLFKDVSYYVNRFPSGDFIDIVAIPLDITGKKIKYIDMNVNSELSDTARGKTVYIVGYPSDSLKIVSAKIEQWGGTTASYAISKPSSFGASGCPVFLDNVQKKLRFGGVYVGRYKETNKGVVIKPGVLISLLNTHSR
jgi:hypothetical protein